MADHPHVHDDVSVPPPERPFDSGSQALSEALRSSFTIVKLVMVVLVLVFLGSGFFTVGPEQRAIILRLGKPVGEGEKALLGPGLHWSFPYPIDEHVIVSITGLQQLRSTAGWYATTPAQEAAGTELPPAPDTPINPAQDGYALSADGNIVHTRATLSYRINDPVRYVFNFVNASNAIQSALDDALLHAAAHHSIDAILTRDVIGFTDAVRRRAVELIEKQNLGITVEQCAVQSIPPRQIKGAFESVLSAELARSRVLNDALTYANQTTNRASADAQAIINNAQSERARLVSEVSSRADQFEKLLPKYLANPALFTQQRLLDVVGRSMTNLQDKIFLPEAADGKRKELRLLLNTEPRLKTEEQKP
jgi:membrane protease subunit HflK